MTREQLKERVRRLPMQPGVYMHKDKTGRVIYVGKAKLLRNRVANYFQPPERLNAKTRQLVSHIDTFDIIVTESEFEALVLENSMIKKYQPKYNILLKDDKGYPYIRLDTTQDYPRFTVVSRPAEDGARYFGPYMGRKAAFSAIDTISDKNIQRLLESVNQIRDAQDVTTAIEAAYEFQHEFALISGNTLIPLIFQSFRAPIFNMWEHYCELYGIEELYRSNYKTWTYIRDRDTQGAVTWIRTSMQDCINGEHQIYYEL